MLDQEADVCAEMYPCSLCKNFVKFDEASQHPCFEGYGYVGVSDQKMLIPISVEEIPGDLEENNENSPLNQQSNGNIDKQNRSPEELLIIEVQARPGLWKISDKKLLSIKDKSQILNLWKEVHQKLIDHYPTIDDVKKKWKGLYDTFKKALLAQRTKKSGSAAPKPKKWKYFDQMSFLIDQDLTYNNLSYSNMDKTSDDNDDSHEVNETIDDEVDEPARIGKRNSKNKQSQDILEKIADSLSKPIPAPQIQIPSIPWMPLPMPSPVPSQVETDNDDIKGFSILIEKKLRKMSTVRASYVMFKIHELMYDEERQQASGSEI